MNDRDQCRVPPSFPCDCAGSIANQVLPDAQRAQGSDSTGCVVLHKKLRHEQFLPFFAKQPACTVAMEACSSSHHWGRRRGVHPITTVIRPAHPEFPHDLVPTPSPPYLVIACFAWKLVEVGSVDKEGCLLERPNPCGRHGGYQAGLLHRQ
ncbi:transposase IS116/IS110/IS902 [Ochrobactrum sp. CDB2]|nr:transposase IS116/IS110/IS902 [Ochrobactrum sp. CDB2]